MSPPPVRMGRPPLPYGGPKSRSCPFHVGTTVGAGNGHGARSRTGYRQAMIRACVGCSLAHREMQRTRASARHRALDLAAVDAAVIGHRLTLTSAEIQAAVLRLDRGGQRSAAEIARIIGVHPRTVARKRKLTREGA